MGDVPGWYATIACARYLGVAPWELLERPAAWTHMGLAAMSAESRANSQRRAK